MYRKILQSTSKRRLQLVLDKVLKKKIEPIKNKSILVINKIKNEKDNIK